MDNASKFITGLLNSLEIITCISLSSCDTKQKDKTTDERYKIKNSILEALETLKKPSLTAEQKNNIADFCVNNDIQNLKKLTVTNLEHILQDQKLASSVLNSIWIYVLNELNVNEFEILNDIQKEKIAQMFIDETIDISDNNTIKSNLSRYKKALEGHKQPNTPTQNKTDTTNTLLLKIKLILPTLLLKIKLILPTLLHKIKLILLILLHKIKLILLILLHKIKLMLLDLLEKR